MKNPTKFRGIIVIGTVIVFALSLAGCATPVPIKSVRPPTINTSSIKRLAIKDFENKSGVGGSLGSQLTNYLTDKAKQIIPASNYFTIVGANDPNAEGVFTGEIRSITVNDSSQQYSRTYKNDDGTTYTVPYTQYTRKVFLEFRYSIISSREGTEVGTVTKQGSDSSSSENPSSLSDPMSLARRIVDSQIRTLERDIVPTIVSQNVNLMEEKSKDKVAKQRMKEAKELVKNNNYEEAIRLYDEINTPAARNNAGILRRSIESDVAARSQLAELYSDKDGKAEKAAKNAIDALAKLPAGANIMIGINSSTERSMLNYVVDQMTKTIIQEEKLKVVERSNIDLVNAEQQYQASGNVDDASFVSIGKQLGVQYIVLCGISGVASLRQLTLRVINVETAQVIDQQGFEI